MKVFTVNAANYECAEDSVRHCDFDDFSPYGAYQTRLAAEMSILKEINEEQAENREFEDDDKLPGFTDYPDLKPEELKWTEIKNGLTNEVFRWKFTNEYDETVYIITELELEG